VNLIAGAPVTAIRLPETLTGYVGVIMFGGPMSANDEDAWLRREIDWIGVPLKENTPFLGICLGAQMLARHLGHRVRPHPHGQSRLLPDPSDGTRASHLRLLEESSNWETAAPDH
jgi:GMP synthase (glutamine-hydrolysing)